MNPKQPNDGGPAFPWRYMDRDSTGTEVTREQGEGMSLRDWFASLAMAANIMRGEFPSRAAQSAYATADAMIAARNNQPPANQ